MNMNAGVRQTGIFALGIGTYVYLHHKIHGHSLQAEEVADVNVCTASKFFVEGKAAVPRRLVQSGPLVLKLVHVQVIFRHGARTCLHLTKNMHEANYDPEFLMREHQPSLFPYDRLLYSTKKPVGWSEFETQYNFNPLKSGACLGALTTYGKEQMYLLGKTLQRCYRDALNMATYDPNEVLVLSSNIRRTVESARCVMAGFYGKEQLNAFAEYCFPVKIYVTDRIYDIMIPDTTGCNVLKKVNNATMFNSDSIPGFKEDRLKIEEKLNEAKEKKMCVVRLAQDKVNKLSKCFSPGTTGTKEYNEYAQECLQDPILKTALEERSQAMSKVDRLWADALVRNPYLSDIITKSDLAALNYLNRLDVEEFSRGYRFHFHFDPNPYFWNEHLCKEVYTKSPAISANCVPFVDKSKANDAGSLPCASTSTPVLWKKCRNLLTDINADGEVLCRCPEDDSGRGNKVIPKQQRRCRGGGLDSSGKSFFKWYLQPTCAEHDLVGKAIKDEVWPDPIQVLENERKHKDPWEEDFNFVSARDDLMSRKAHGLPIPRELEKYKKVIICRATEMLHSAMTGQNITERTVITRLSAGPLVTKIVDVLENVTKEIGNSPKLCLFSTHDSTMTGLLEAFGLWDDEWPPFGANIRIELYRDMNSPEYYVRVLYCGEVVRISCQKEDFMHWSDFRKSIKTFMIREGEFRDVCSSDVLDRLAKNRYNESPTSAVPAGM
ncbi:hypothetical protein BsWGS_17118 [Bradybaena similaris]